MNRFGLIILLFVLFVIADFAQKPTPTPSNNEENEVVKISTSLVQLDAVVTDKEGHPVINLMADDFEIWQDGKPQKITNLVYINRITRSEKLAQTQTIVSPTKEKNAPLLPPVSTRSAEFGRVLTFVVDDGNCAVTQLGMIAAKDGLEKFVKEQMLPNDSVAIYQTRNGSSLLQQYTSDKTRLLGITKKIRWYPPNGICGSIAGGNYEPVQNNANEKLPDAAQRESIEASTNDRQIAGIIGVTRYAINGLRQIGGRKVIFIMSDSLPLMFGKRENIEISRATSAIKELTDLANRTSVVLNTIDVRGLTNSSMLEAADDPEGLAREGGEKGAENFIASRNLSDTQRRSGLTTLAIETGGKFFENTNSLEVPIQKALDLEKGYYLLGYQPDEETFKGKSFHKIEIKLKRPDLKISSRAGFYGVTDNEIRPKSRGGDSELYNALVSPLPNADMNVRLSAYFANTPNKGNFIHALLYIDGREITFADSANGNKKVIFDLVAVTLDAKNKVIDDSNSTQTIQIPTDKVAEIQRNGLIYTLDVPVKKEGIYTFRTALRDATAKRIGSSSQVIEVPDLKKDKLYLSGLIISGVDSNGKILESETAANKNVFSSVVSKSVPAIRQFRRNTIVGYAFTIYNAKIETAANQPKITIQTNLYSEGKLITQGTPQTAQIEKQADLTRINDYGYLRLNQNLLPGDYALQIIVRDLQTNQTSSQWIDFEVIE